MSVTTAVKNYFDIRKKIPSTKIRTLAGRTNYVFPQYIALLGGIVVQPFLEYYIQHNDWSFTWQTIGARTLFGLLVGLAIFPAVYRRAWDNDSPLFVQLGSVFSAGLGWQTLFSAGAHLAN